MLACHVGGLAWSGVSSAIVRLYNCLCVRGAYVLSAPVPTSSTFIKFSWVDSPGAASSLESLKLACATWIDSPGAVSRSTERGDTQERGHVRDCELRKASKSGWREEERHGSHSL